MLAEAITENESNIKRKKELGRHRVIARTSNES